jgi:internalin A
LDLVWPSDRLYRDIPDAIMNLDRCSDRVLLKANILMGYQSKNIQILSLLLILSYTWIFTASATARPQLYTRFADWCHNQKTLPPQTHKTVTVILSLMETQDCDLAQLKLLSTEYLNFDTTPLSKPDTGGSEPISDLSPLTSLPYLTGLNLYGNPITNLAPLAQLKNLTTLDLRNNAVRDIAPLSSLQQLTSLDLRGNEVSDLKPLNRLQQLNALYLGQNKIKNISPLALLKNLKYLDLGGNNIQTITALAGLSKLETLFLQDNKIRNISPLSNLINMTFLDISNNQITVFRPLQVLPKLDELKVFGNPGIDERKPCPVASVKTCILTDQGQGQP